MSISWPQEVVDDIARRRSVIILGAGISRHAQNIVGAHPKLWDEFLNAVVNQIPGPQVRRTSITKLVQQHDYLTACQVIKDVLGAPAFHAFAQQEYLTPGFQAAPIHDRIIELDSRIVATPNFDTIYENRVNHVQHNTVAIRNYYEASVADTIRSARRMVLKVHGTIHAPDQMIFTRQEYTRARNEYFGFYTILEALAITHTFLFLGCGLDDPDIRLLLEDYSWKYKFARPHYFVMPRAKLHQSVRTAVEQSMNIKILTYDTPGQSHHLLVKGIEDLRDAVNKKRVIIAASGDWW